MTTTYSYYNQSINQLNLGQSYGRPAPYGWGIELAVDDGSIERNSLVYMFSGSEVIRRDYRAKTAFRVETSSNARYLLFSVFNAPYHDSSNQHWSDDIVEYSAYFRGLKYSGVRFGILELNEKGDFVTIIAEKTIPEEPLNGYDFPQAWIHNVKLTPGRLYAYFVETEQGWPSCTLNEAGVFFNPEGVDIVPDMKPRVTDHLRMVEEFGQYSKAELIQGVTVDVGRYPMPFGMGKHLIMSVCYDRQGSQTNHYPPLSITKQDYKSVLVLGNDKTNDGSHVLAFYSPYPVHLNYFNSPHYVAP
ncbi:hypothetical protein [Vibrio hangzhouensis]|uniref:Uncharacterized protein n=1 Tax=Vibrio hangzhouensis TaxID=462991 RepID=A0A1H5WHY3_9VIBR|nr:hypothetical protein [Vibrio hangzhouensis]SEF98467.1 hypothetical protein SAMN04488244_105260 [Vibrio hangzhouensis]